MRKIFCIVVFLYTFQLLEAQVTWRPTVRSSNTVGTGTSIDGIIVQPDETYILLNVYQWLYSSIWHWVSVIPETYIEYTDPTTGEKQRLQITRVEDNKGNELNFNTRIYHPHQSLTLMFPPIPREVDCINLIEEGGWRFKGITFTPRQDWQTNPIVNTEEKLNELVDKSKHEFTGFYEQLIIDKKTEVLRLAVIQNDTLTKDNFIALVYADATDQNWKFGEVKAALEATAVPNVYKGLWLNNSKRPVQAVVTFEGATMKILIEAEMFFEDDEPVYQESIYVKMAKDLARAPQQTSLEWSGTGFALRDGYIITNHHVINDATEIKIQGINGDFLTEYTAQVVGVDKSNDLALLKISGDVPASFNTIPYGIKTSISEVGENIYVLGYPLTATMGEEIKLTNGIISARTGFEGDVTTYQISAPVQPGNSGGPMFDDNGNVIGVICSKHIGAENVSYAVKTSQVRILIESITDPSILNTKNTLQGKNLKDQVKEVKNYVYLIKCSK